MIRRAVDYVYRAFSFVSIVNKRDSLSQTYRLASQPVFHCR